MYALLLGAGEEDKGEMMVLRLRWHSHLWAGSMSDA